MTTIHCEVYGLGRPLVLLHGWAMHTGIWRGFAKQLARRYRVICLDLPSHGRSDAVQAFTLPEISAALLDAIPVEKFSLLGWSLGASVAIDLAARCPGRVESLLLLAGNPHFVETEDWPGVKAQILDTFSEQLTDNLAQTLMRFLALQVNGLSDGKRLLQDLKRAMQGSEPPPVDVLQRGLDILRRGDLRSQLSRLQCPVSLIQGDRDGLIPVTCGQAMRNLLPQIGVHVLKNAGHVPFLSHEKELIDIVDIILKPDDRLDKAQIKRSFGAASGSYDALAALQRRVGLALLEKYPLEASAGVVVDVGSGTGFLSRQLPIDFEGQRLVALDIALPMLHVSQQKNSGASIGYLCADAEQMPFAERSIRQLYSNLAFQWCQDLSVLFAECKRVLASGGQLAFATFGPATLQELKAAWSAVDDYPHVNEFHRPEQICQLLREAGFQTIESDTVTYRSHYPSVMALMRELKGIGAHNVNLARNRKPTTRSQLQRMVEYYETVMPGGDVHASYEIIFVRARL